MAHTGVLRNWHDDRGFGFIAPTQGGPEIFVHIGAFPRDGSRPTVGERLGYELAPGRDGKPQAVNVTRLAVGAARPLAVPVGADDRPDRSSAWERRERADGSGPAARREREDRSRSPLLGTIAVVVLLGVLGAWGYRTYSTSMHRKALAAQPVERVAEPAMASPDPAPPPAAPVAQPATASFTCDGRTHCSQMTSCAEATWFVNHCPGTKMDGNRGGDGGGNGVPCERQWCKGPLAR